MADETRGTVDETAMTATLTWNPTAPHYSFFGGNAAVLKNGNVEYCESAGPTGTSSSGVGLAHCYNLPPSRGKRYVVQVSPLTARIFAFFA